MSQEAYLKSLSEGSRLSFLEDNAQHIDEGKYVKSMSAEEIADAKTSLSENCIKLSDLQEELDESKKIFKDKMDPFKKSNVVILQEIRTRQRLVMGSLYHIPNHADGMMESYNGSGELISSRRLRPDERQGGLFSLNKAVNDNN